MKISHLLHLILEIRCLKKDSQKKLLKKRFGDNSNIDNGVVSLWVIYTDELRALTAQRLNLNTDLPFSCINKMSFTGACIWLNSTLNYQSCKIGMVTCCRVHKKKPCLNARYAFV